jgi:hypothetical protein
MKKENRKLRYILYVMFNAKHANNDKLKRIKLICEE